MNNVVQNDIGSHLLYPIELTYSTDDDDDDEGCTPNGPITVPEIQGCINTLDKKIRPIKLIKKEN